MLQFAYQIISFIKKESFELPKGKLKLILLLETLETTSTLCAESYIVLKIKWNLFIKCSVNKENYLKLYSGFFGEAEERN